MSDIYGKCQVCNQSLDDGHKCPVPGIIINRINPMFTAPKDGTPVLLKFKDNLSGYNRNIIWQKTLIVGKNTGDFKEWTFAAPVAQEGFPDKWFQGWYDISES